MKGSTHLWMGATLALVAGKSIFEGADVTSLIAYGALGGIISDIDSPQSMISEIMPFVDKAWAKVRKFLKKMPKKTLLADIGEAMEHRGITHTIWFCMIPWFFWAVNPIASFGLIAGILSHILVDMLNKHEIKPFYPLWNWGICLKLIKVGDTKEIALVYLVVLAFLGQFWP